MSVIIKLRTSGFLAVTGPRLFFFGICVVYAMKTDSIGVVRRLEIGDTHSEEIDAGANLVGGRVILAAFCVRLCYQEEVVEKEDFSLMGSRTLLFVSVHNLKRYNY